VGRICVQKNQLQTIEAATHVISEHPSAVFVFLGNSQETDYVARLRERTIELGIQDNIRLPGFQRDAAAYFRGSDVLAHTSRKESQGRVLLEAMAARLPVVAYDVGGISESVVADETGFLVPFGDVMGLAQSLGKLVSNAALRQRMGESGYRRVSQCFTAERTAERVNAVIKRTLSK
jgi:glycosyltransferase involved in cell wall biosynthesis